MREQVLGGMRVAVIVVAARGCEADAGGGSLQGHGPVVHARELRIVHIRTLKTSHSTLQHLLACHKSSQACSVCQRQDDKTVNVLCDVLEAINNNHLVFSILSGLVMVE